MTGPLVFLAVLAVGAGWVGLPWMGHGFATYVFHGEAYHPHANYLLMVIGTVVGLSGIGLAYLMYYRKSISPEAMAARFGPLYRLLYNKYYIDEIYDAIVIKPILTFARFMWSFDARVVDGAVNGTGWLTIRWSDIKEWFDTWIVDGAVNGAGWLVCQGSRLLRFLQSGRVQFYALFMLAMAVLLVSLKFLAPYFADENLEWTDLLLWFLGGTAVMILLAWVWRREEVATGEKNIPQEE
jgi:NADH-quinone oxidoreductase subunit L